MKTYILLITFALTGCITTLTPQGSEIVILDEDTNYKCIFIDIVTGTNSMGVDAGHNSEGALNEIRNEAAKLGANAVQIISMNSNRAIMTATGKALKCNFDV